MMKLKRIITDFLMAKEVENLSKNSIRTYKYATTELYAFCGDIEIEELTPSLLREFFAFERERDGRHGNLDSSTLRQIYTITGIFLKWAVNQGYVSETPIKKVGKPRGEEKLPEALSDEELERMFSYIIRNRQPRIQVLFEFMLDTGCRVSEVAKLDIEDVHLDENWVKIKGKGSREAIVPIGNRMSDQLYRYIHELRPESNSKALFVTGMGDRYKPISIAGIVRRVMETVNVQGKHGPHKLRHTFATNYLRNGGNLESLRRILRHRSISTTQRYLSLTNEDIRDEHQRFSPLDSFFRPH